MRRNRYCNKKTEWNGMLFDSKLEAKMYSELWAREKAGEILGLERQIKIPLEVNGVKICDWIVDAKYRDVKTYRIHLIDAKGKLMADSSIKFKLAKALFPLCEIDFYPSVKERKAKAVAKGLRTKAKNKLFKGKI